MSPGATLFLFLAPGAGAATPEIAGPTQFVGPFGWSFFFAGSTPKPVAVRYRDDDFFSAIVGLLGDTGEFDRVIYARRPDAASKATSDEPRVAVVTPTDRFRQADEGSPRRQNRQVDYTLTVRVLDEDVESARAEADRLYGICNNALGSVSLLGVSLPWQSGLRAGSYRDGPGNSAEIRATGQFGYSFETSVGLRTTS